MPKIEKRFQRIVNNPVGVKWSELQTIIEYYGLTVYPPNSGSHWMVFYEDDPELDQIPVPVHSNNVKTIYVKRVVKLILHVIELKEE